MPIRRTIRKIERFLIYRVLHVDDTPHRIALGVAIGVFVTWTPTIGMQMILTVLLSLALRANKVVGLPFVWISNPLTFVPIYYPSYRLGNWLLGERAGTPDFHRILAVEGDWWGEIWFNRLQAWWSAAWNTLAPTWLGSLLIALPLAAIGYFVTRRLIVLYRQRRHAKLAGARDETAPTETSAHS